MSNLLEKFMKKPMSILELKSTPTRGSSSQCSLLGSSLQKPMSELEFESTPIMGSSSHGPLLESSLKLGARSACMNLDGATSLSFQDPDTAPNTTSKIPTMKKTMMSQVAMAAKEELLKLLCTNEPLWFKSSLDQRFFLQLERYEKLFPRINHFQNSKARVESSKDSGIVKIKAMELVDMLLDSVSTYNFNIYFPLIIYLRSFSLYIYI